MRARRDLERRRGAGAGPLFGLPIPVKDSVNTRDYPTSGGTPALRRFRPAADAPLVAGAARGRRDRARQDQPARAVVRLDQQQPELRRGAQPVRPARASPAAAAAAPPRRLRRTSRRSASPRIPRARSACRRRCAASPASGRRPGRYPTQRLRADIGAVRPGRSACAQRRRSGAVRQRRRHGDPAPLAAVRLQGVRLGVVRDYWFAGLDPEVERCHVGGARAPPRRGSRAGRVGPAGTAGADRCSHDCRSRITTCPSRWPATSATTAPASASRHWSRRPSPDIRSYLSQRHHCPARTEPHFRGSVPRRPATGRCRRYVRCCSDYFARERVAAIVFPATMVPAPRIGDEDQLDVGGRRVPFTVAIARNIDPGSTAGVPGLVLPAGLTPLRPAGGAGVRRPRRQGSQPAGARRRRRGGAGTPAAASDLSGALHHGQRRREVQAGAVAGRSSPCVSMKCDDLGEALLASSGW